ITSGVAACQYQDAGNAIATSSRTQSACYTGTWQGGTSDPSINSRLQQTMYVGETIHAGSNTCDPGGTHSCTPSDDWIAYIPRITIWTCAAGNSTSTGCGTGILTSSP